MKKVSIIIPVKEINDYIRESLPYIEKLDYDKNSIEVIILPDNAGKIEGNFTFSMKIMPTGHIYPGAKRDIGIKNTTGEIIAFIDDDVFPDKDWLKRAVEIFEESAQIGAVGGPAATPEHDSFLQKVSGNIYASFLGGGGYRYRYIAEPRRDVDDYPSCNLLVRRDVLQKIGGFNTDFWPGEDTVICLKIVKELKLRIVYDPKVFVYHHRRNFMAGHINQVKSYAMHRGYFVKRFPETSFRLTYFVPTFFVIYASALLIAYWVLSASLYVLMSMPMWIYIALLIVDGAKLRGIKMAFYTMFGIFVTHIYYGVYFMLGLLSARLKEAK